MKDILSNWNGIKVIASLSINNYSTTPMRKHKKKRIQKKWIKRFGYKPNTTAVRVGNTIFCSELQLERLAKISSLTNT